MAEGEAEGALVVATRLAAAVAMAARVALEVATVAGSAVATALVTPELATVVAVRLAVARLAFHSGLCLLWSLPDSSDPKRSEALCLSTCSSRTLFDRSGCPCIGLRPASEGAGQQ